MLKRVSKIIGILLIAIVILVITKAQYDVEKYIKKQKQTYGILENRQRIKFTSFVWHYFTKADNLGYVIHLPYNEIQLKQYFSHGIYDEYLVDCFYTKQEIEKAEEISLNSFGHGIWKIFVQAVHEKNIEYLTMHSFDTIFCSDCSPYTLYKNKRYES